MSAASIEETGFYGKAISPSSGNSRGLELLLKQQQQNPDLKEVVANQEMMFVTIVMAVQL